MRKNRLSRLAVICAAAMAISSTFSACSPKKTQENVGSSSESVSSENMTSSSASVSSQTASTININSSLSNSEQAQKAGSQYAAASYKQKDYFSATAKQKETKISINNKNIIAPPIKSTANGASPVKRTTIEGVDGTFVNPKINEKVVDLKGKTFNLGTFWKSEWQAGASDTAADKATTKIFNQIQTDYNCKIKLKAMDSGTYLTTVSTGKASGTAYADIYELQNEMGDLFRTGDLQDLQTVASVDYKGNQWNPVYSLCTSFKNKVYGVGLRYDHVEHNVLIFNRDLAQKYNLGDLYGFASSGKWTDDLFMQVSQRFQKLNTDKTIYTCQGLFPEEILNLVYTNWTSPFGITSSKYIFNGQDQTVLDILSFAQDYTKQGMYDKTIAKGDWQTDGTFKDSSADAGYSIASFQKGKTLFYLGSDTLLPGFPKSCKNKYGILPMPKGPAADGYTSAIVNCKYFSLMVNDPQLEDAGRLLVALANRTNISTDNVVSNNQQIVEDSQSVTQLTNNYTYKQILSVGLCGSTTLPWIFYGAALKSVIQQSETPKQAMDSIAVKAQTEINTTFGQS